MPTLTALLLQADTAATARGGSWSARTLLTLEGAVPFLRAALLLVVGLPLVYLAGKWLRQWVAKRYSAQQGMVAGKLFFYVGIAIVLVTVLMELGFSLAPLLGAAGILGIALGFASQTSVSNVISGFFLMAERPFVVDDVIQVGETVGRVLSIDMMSVKLRTFDNKFVRIPNESIVKSQVTTVTRFPIRRLDVNVGVAYKEDVGRVREVLLEVADRNPRALMEPPPLVIFNGYGESSINLLFAVWSTRENWLTLKNTIQEEIKIRFDEEGIEIPFPHRTLYAGLASEPFPVKVVGGGGESERERGGTEPPAPGAAREPSSRDEPV